MHMMFEQELRKLFSLLLPVAGWRVPVAMRHGKDRAGRDVKLLTAGANGITGYVASLFFSGESRAEEMGSVPVWRLERFLENHASNCDLAVAGIDRHSARWFLHSDWLRCPAWVASTARTPNGLIELVKKNEQIYRDWRYIQKNPFECVESTDIADLKLFYERYYKPFICERHGDLVHVRSWRDMRWRFRRGCLLWLFRDGVRVAGTLRAWRNGVMESIAFGLLDGRVELRRHGTMTALYAHTFELARKQDCNTVFLGGTRPSLHDKVWRTKRRWGASLQLHPEVNFEMCLRWNRLAGPVADFLGHTSIIHHDSGSLSGLWVCPPEIAGSRTELAKEINRLSSPGLRRMTIVLPAAAQRPPIPNVCFVDSESASSGGPELLHAC
jgi:hypothetical protein